MIGLITIILFSKELNKEELEVDKESGDNQRDSVQDSDEI
jgi:hypothetical protein